MPILKSDMGEKVAGIQVGGGSLTKPSLSFQNDEDTGFMPRTAGGISVVVDAVEVLSLTADGIAFPLLTAASVPFVGAAGVLTEENANLFYTAATNILTATGGVVTAAIGPAATQQHTLPAVASDTVALLAAAQTLTTKTLTSPIVGTQITLDQTTADYTFTWANPAAARAISIIDPGGTDAFLWRDATQTVTNKTLNLTSNTLVATSAQLITAVTDETGSSLLVFNTSPTLVTPLLGTPTSGVLTNCTGLPAASVVAGTFGTGNFTFPADLTITDQLIVSGTGPHAIGGATSDATQFFLTGSYTSVGDDAAALKITSTIVAGVGKDAAGYHTAPGLNRAASGAHNIFAALRIHAPAIGGGAGTVTNAVSVYIKDGPTGATNNYALWVDAGEVRLDATTANGTVATAMSSLGPVGSNTTIQEWLTININGTVRYIPCF